MRGVSKIIYTSLPGALGGIYTITNIPTGLFMKRDKIVVINKKLKNNKYIFAKYLLLEKPKQSKAWALISLSPARMAMNPEQHIFISHLTEHVP
jgi:hypothetical protein